MLEKVLIGIVIFIIIMLVILRTVSNGDGDSVSGKIFRKLKESCGGCFKRR